MWVTPRASQLHSHENCKDLCRRCHTAGLAFLDHMLLHEGLARADDDERLQHALALRRLPATGAVCPCSFLSFCFRLHTGGSILSRFPFEARGTFLKGFEGIGTSSNIWHHQSSAGLDIPIVWIGQWLQ